MIGSIVRTGLLNLRRDRSALLLTFVLPIAFFSIFAVIFGQTRNSTPKVRVILVDQDNSPVSRRIVSALKKESALTVLTAPAAKKGEPEVPHTAESAERAVREGDAPVALIIPKGFGSAPLAFGPNGQRMSIEMLRDISDPIAPQMVSGLLQKTAMTSMPDVMADEGMKYFDEFAGGLTPSQRSNIKQELGELHQMVTEREKGAEGASASNSSDSNSSNFDGLVSVKERDIMGENKKNPTVAFYAAGIGVMFLLFSASGGGGALLEEAESGTLDRVLSTRISMPMLLGGKLAYLTLIGIAQLTVMFVWAAVVFRVELWTHLPGFFAMAFLTALAAGTLGLVLATASRTRAQLGAISTLIILVMSALGGSMFPRFLMPETLQKVGKLTFNAWAIDGFTKVFWRDEPVSHLWPEMLVLGIASVIMFAIARQLARRWEFS